MGGWGGGGGVMLGEVGWGKQLKGPVADFP